MECDSPYQMFSPIHPAWLHRQHDRKRDVTSADLDAIEAAFPMASGDPLFAEYRARAAAGTLRRRPGRKPITIPQLVRLWAVRFAIEDEMRAIWTRRHSGETRRARGDREPYYQAVEIVIERFKLYCSPETLVNRLSRLGMS